MSSTGTNMPRPPKLDRDLQRDVLNELNRDGRLTPAEVGVEVSGGVVTLTGTVSRPDKVDAAANVAVSVVGVRDVANKLVVEADAGEHDDTKIAHAARHALGWNTAVPAEQIDSIVRRGVVTLRGNVEHWYQRNAAEETVAAIAGVAAVTNEIQLFVPPTRDDVLREVEGHGRAVAALRRP
jgi:osmotically-inducible protein OsmY